MNENINLVEILKDCPRGTKLYSPSIGDVTFDGILSPYNNNDDYYISVLTNNRSTRFVFTKNGKFDNMFTESGCMLFPSKDQMDWSKFKVKKLRFDPKTLQPFDKVLVKIKNEDYYMWFVDFISIPLTIFNKQLSVMSVANADLIIPYNDETKHLVGTMEEAPEYYRYWED